MSSSNRLDLSFLKQALGQFDVGIAEYDTEPERRADGDSVVMHFLFPLELTPQAIKRYLELQSVKAGEVSDLSFQTIIRRADDLGIDRTGWPGFGNFRDARNAIAHSYTDQRALAVVGWAKEFAPESHFLLEVLERRAADEN